MALFNKIIETIKEFKDSKIIKKWKRAGCPIPTPHLVKQLAIKKYKHIYEYKILVETGTFRGDMVYAQRKNFEHIYSIELSEKLWADAVTRFQKFNNISIMQGDSGNVLKEIINTLNQPAIFWLDGHYSAGETAKGEKECPIFEELDCIFLNNKFNHVLLIDDARCFNGEGDYPTIEDLTAYIKSKNNKYQLEVKDDILRYTVLS
jgi:hypothetical protein